MVAITALLAGCAHHRHAGPPPTGTGVHYVLGQPYQAGGVWRYPRQQFSYDETGLATLTAGGRHLTIDGETADPGAMAAAHPTLQLPAIARVTNLDTGLQALVRVNDRGPAQPGRLIAVTPRVFQLLGAGGQATMRVRVTVLDTESRWLVAELKAGDPPLPVAVAPADAVTVEWLPPPAGAKQSSSLRRAPEGPRPAAAVPVASAPVPLRLPEQVTQVAPRPGAFYVEAGAFAGLQYAELLRARLAFLGARTSTSYDAPRDRAYRVRIGPLGSVAEADAILQRTTSAGVADARIVAE